VVRSGPLVKRATQMVATVGSNTMMIAVRMSVTIAISGVATNGKPKPSAPWSSPASRVTHASHSSTAAESDSNGIAHGT
jgi:hypothetical protein